MRVIFYDLETTGFLPCGIMQICMIGIETDNEPSVLEYTTLVNPGERQVNRRVPHNLTLEDVREAPMFEDISDALNEFIRGSTLVGFNNRRFDDRVLESAFGIENIFEIIESSHDILPIVGGIRQDRALGEQDLMNPRSHDAWYDVMSLIALVNRLDLGEDFPEECSIAAELLVGLLDMTEFNIPTAEDVPTYSENFVDDGYITVGIYAGRTLENIVAEDPWFANFLN